MNLKQYFKNHSIRLMAKRAKISESSLRRYRDQDRRVPLSVAYRLELCSYGKVCLWELLSEEEQKEYDSVKLEMSNLSRVVKIIDHGEDLL